MAKKAAPTKSGGGTGKNAAAKPRSAKSKAVARPTRAQSSGSQERTRRTSEGAQENQFSATDALMKLIESPLMADLLTVAATAALAVIAESRFRGRGDPDRGSSSAVRAAAKAALAAVGRRLAKEVEEIRTAAKSARDSAGA